MSNYLYSPVNGSFNMCPYPLEYYCPGLNGQGATCDPPGGPHKRVQLQSPMDIITNWAAPVYLYVSVGINSVTVVHYGNACACFCGPTFAVQCHFYTGTGGGGSYVGSTYFGHIENRHPQGTYNLLENESAPFFHYLSTPLGYCAAPGGGTPEMPCSSVRHPHVEQIQATTGSEVQCPDGSVAAATWLYRWG